LIDQVKYEQLLKAFKRERQSRKEAERIIEQKALELYYANSKLKEINKNLEDRIIERTQDIEKSKDELVIAKKIAEEATLAKSAFLSNMTHELRTPLNGIIGLTELLLSEELTSHVFEMLENIKFSANHLSHIINEILDFSKIEAGKISFENIEFSLPDLINATHKNLLISAENKGVDLLLKYDSSIPATLKGDPVKLKQILNNLIGNALKFTSSGFARLTCKLIEYDSSNGIVNVRFDIKDTGIGIKKENLDSIFSSFTQSDSSISRQYGGTGLGLTITKNFVELQGGSITVSSKYGLGSTFSFNIPFRFISYKNKEKEKLKGFIQEPLNAKILVVDDVIINQMVVAKILNKWNVDVDIASSGKQALHLLKRHRYDLILMDVQMPEMSGTETTRIIRNDNEFSHVAQIPIIAFTANAFDSSRQQVLDAGMNSFVSKPVHPDDLYNAITHLLTKTSI
jgi:signal transduction histidine kinase/ActR/RegA family two-component response regulator